ncbi:cell division control Cdc6 [Venturia nashicola]|nr:cell division control Cdc6 [Venturia nashicola]
MPTILGKRNRGSVEHNGQSRTTAPAQVCSKLTINQDATPDLSPRKTRAKRRADFVIAADEDENPFVARKTRKISRNGADAMELDELDELAVENAASPKKSTSVRTSPAKHGAPESRIPLPPRTSPAKHGVPESRIPLPPRKRRIQSRVNDIELEEESKPTTPSTPRHRDALSKKIPITPRHRVGLVGRPSTPQTQRTPSTPRLSGYSVYNTARQAFARGGNTERLVGREQESQELSEYVSERLLERSSGCIYISGPPGTGKSALVNQVCTELQGDISHNSTYVNCMSVKTAKDIFAKLLDDFEKTDVLEGSETEALEEMFHDGKTAYLVTLDEIDHLLDVDIDLLYKLFEWSLEQSSNLVIVGIANALDFTDRFLPRLKSRGLRPQLLPFMPYSVPQIASVLTAKLRSLLPTTTTAAADFVPFVHPTAIQFASKKVAAQTGDLRKAFAICLRAIDLIESETTASLIKATENTPSPTPSPTKTPLLENMNLASPSAVRTPKRTSEPLAHLTIETAPRATIAHMARVTAAVFSNGASQRLLSLNLQQKAVLCSLIALEQKRKKQVTSTFEPSPFRTANSATSTMLAAPTLKALFLTYTTLCRTENALHPLTNTEFRDVITGLETLSLVSWVDGKNGTFTNNAPGTPSRRGGRGGGFGAKVVEEKRVASSISVKEVRESLRGVGAGILMGVLEGDGI